MNKIFDNIHIIIPSAWVYPGYQRFFSRAVEIFGVGFARVGYKDLTETGNRATKVSGTQGNVSATSHWKHNLPASTECFHSRGHHLCKFNGTTKKGFT